MSAKRRLTVKTVVLATVLFALIAVWSLYNRQFQQTLGNRLLLNSANPQEGFFAELATQSDDPVGFLQRSWATGKVTHRQLVAAFLKDSACTNAAWLDRADSLLLACALDADASV